MKIYTLVSEVRITFMKRSFQETQKTCRKRSQEVFWQVGEKVFSAKGRFPSKKNFHIPFCQIELESLYF